MSSPDFMYISGFSFLPPDFIYRVPISGFVFFQFLAAALHVERLRLPPWTPVVVIDSADMMVQGDLLAIAAAAEELLKRAPLVFGAKAYCVP